MQVKKIRFNTETKLWEYVDDVASENSPTLEELIKILDMSNDNVKRPESFTEILVGLLPSIEMGVEELKESFKDKTMEPIKSWFDKSDSNKEDFKQSMEKFLKKFDVNKSVIKKPQLTIRERLEKKRQALLDEQQKARDESFQKFVDNVVNIIINNIESQLSQYNGGDIFAVYTEINYKALPSDRTVDELIQSVNEVLYNKQGIDVEDCIACKVNTNERTVVFEYVEDLN